MRTVKLAFLVGLFCALPMSSFVLRMSGQDRPPSGAPSSAGTLQSGALDQVISKVIARENQEMGIIRQRSPIVETYIQKVNITENDGSWQPDGDHYFIGRAELPNGLELRPLESRDDTPLRHAVAIRSRVVPRSGEDGREDRGP